MKRLALFAMLLLTILGFPPKTAAQEAAKAPSPPAQPNKAARPNANDNPDAQFVQILEQLSTKRLERDKQANAAVPGTVSADDIAALQLQLDAIAKLKNETKDGGKLNWFSMLIGFAECAKASADADWKRVTTIRQQTPQAISDLDAEMVRLRAELADVNLKRGKIAATESADAQQNWALQCLFVQLQGISDRVQVLEERE